MITLSQFNGQSNTHQLARLYKDSVRLQMTTGGYSTKHGQAIRTELIEEFVMPT